MPDLCAHPGAISEAAGGADRLVLGVCSGEYQLGRLQAEARRLTIDPLGMELVRLEDADGDPGRLELLVAAATARAEAFGGSQPQHAKIAFPREVSRRHLADALRPEYRAAPGVLRQRCVADTGCRACVDACPRQAYRWVDGRVEYDRAVCEPCGICVTACPAGAITNPAITPAQLAAELGVLLDGTLGPAGPRGVAYLCARGDASVADPGWFPVRVPCAAMITAPWLLAPLLLGAGAVAISPCSASGCPLGLDPIVEETARYADALLGELGAAGRLRSGPDGPVPEPWARVPLSDPFGTARAASLLTGLAAAAGAPLPAIEHPRSPVGVVTVDQAACTLCGMCAATCPTGALTFDASDLIAELGFDARSCTGCRQCVPRCPEVAAGAIAVDRRIDSGALAAGRRTLYSSGSAHCTSCGGPIASTRLLDRLQARLGPEHAGVYAAIATRCTSCRRQPAAGN